MLFIFILICHTYITLRSTADSIPYHKHTVTAAAALCMFIHSHSFIVLYHSWIVFRYIHMLLLLHSMPSRIQFPISHPIVLYFISLFYVFIYMCSIINISRIPLRMPMRVVVSRDVIADFNLSSDDVATNISIVVSMDLIQIHNWIDNNEKRLKISEIQSMWIRLDRHLQYLIRRTK